MRRLFTFAVLTAALISCSDSNEPSVPGGFLGGTTEDRQIGLLINATGNTLTMFQLGSVTTQQQIPLGTSSSITPVGLSIRGRRAAVPLGNAASVALVNLESASITRFFTFASGNTQGSAWVDDNTLLLANQVLNKVGKVTVNQTGDAVGSLADVPSQPISITMAGNRAIVVSSNLDPQTFAPLGPGKITAINPQTMQVIGTINSGGENSYDAALGPDGMVYVVNTGDYVGQGSLTIVNPATLTVVQTVPNMGVGPGAIHIDKNGLAYISGFFSGTLVWNTVTKAFVRGPDNPVCAKHNGACRGAFAASTSENGDVYQAFFGSSSQGLPPYIFVFNTSTFALKDSISVGVGPATIDVRKY